MDYYEILGVSKDASFDEIKEAYFALRKDLSGPELDLLEMAYRTLANDSKRADYDMGINSHNKTVKIDDGDGFREKVYHTIDLDNPHQEILLRFDDKPNPSIEEEIHSINTYNTLEREAEDLVDEEELEDDLDFYLTPREISRALALLVRGDGDEYIEGTNVIKPRDRRVDETDEEYTAFLEKYYQEHFYIPGTNILKPRDRKANETDEEYNNYLANYYAIIFANKQVQEDDYEEDYDEEEELLEVTDRNRHTKLKKVVRGLLIAGALLLGVLGIKACTANDKDSKAPYGSNTTVDEAIDDAGNTMEEDYSDYDDYAEELEHSIVNPEIDDLPELEEVEEDYSINVGDKFNLDDSTLLYTASTDQEAKGRVNTNAAAIGEYTIDKIVVLDSNNNIVANSSFGEVDLDSYDDSYKKMIHFSRNVTEEDIETGRVERNNEKNLGWVFLENLNANQKIGSVLESGKTK